MKDMTVKVSDHEFEIVQCPFSSSFSKCSKCGKLADIMFLKCWHMFYCSKCLEKTKCTECPECQEKILACEEVYLDILPNN